MDFAAFENIREQHPLIHTITNSVTIESVVNMILASGGTAIGADSPQESADICSLADGLLLNTGTPSESRLEAMILAGKRANGLGIPVVLDPVGAGSSPFRKYFLETLLSQFHATCIRCNMAEARALHTWFYAAGSEKSVAGNQEREKNLGGAVENPGGVEALPGTGKLSEREMRELAARLGAVLAITGETDYIVSPSGGAGVTWQIRTNQGGSPMQKRITGSGCMLSGLLAAALAADFKRRRKLRDAAEAAELLPQKESSAIKPEPEKVSGTKKIESGMMSVDIDRENAFTVLGMLKAYGDAAVVAEKVMKKQGLFGTATFRDMLINVVSAPEAALACIETTSQGE